MGTGKDFESYLPFPSKRMTETCGVGLVNVEGILRKATSFTTEGEFSRLGVKRHVRNLIRTLETIQALVSDAAQGKIPASAVLKLWLEKVNDLNAMADDLLDGFAYEARRLRVVERLRDKKRRNKVCNFFSSYNSFVIWRTKVVRKLKLVSSRYRGFVIEAHIFGLDSHIGVGNATARVEQISQTTDSSAVESQIFQGGNESQKLKEMLLTVGNDRDFFFVSIVGPAGIGKTTLAQVVFNDSEVVNHFDVRMWVCVTEEFSIDRILKSLLACLAVVVSDEMSGRKEILFKLLDRLKGKTYLLVLDDVWLMDLHLWDSFKECLLKLGGSRGSKIMVTTRSRDVVDLLQPGLSHDVALLPDEYCWELFQKVAFPAGGPSMTRKLEDVGRMIVKKCNGLPLAVKVLGHLLYAKGEEEWLQIAHSDLWNMDASSDSVSDVLMLSYNHLPSISLKQCFLYCSIFPEDYAMEKDELIQLWMAQGLLNPPRGSDSSMEDLGAEYLDILVRMSFLQDAEQDEIDRRKSYKMHDLLHELALSLSNGQCSIMKGINDAAMNGLQAAHMSLINGEAEILKSLRENYTKLRTLRLVNSGVPGDMLMYTTSLRVLIVIDWLVDELPGSVSKLKLLHYLDISKTKIKKLPDSISELYNLQTLKLYDLIKLPKNFENLVSLRHLYIEMFKDLDKLSALPPQFQKSINRSFKACFKAHLHSICPIEKLEMLLEHPELYSRLKIYCLENVSGYDEDIIAKLSSISSASTIECLRLHWNARRENIYDEDVLEGLRPHANMKNLAIENYKGSTFPSWMEITSQQLENLVKIELEDCSGSEQVPSLGHLPHLKTVKIQGMINVKSIGAEFYGFSNADDQYSTSSSAWTARAVFPELRELTLREMTSLEKWSEPANLSKHSSNVCPLLEKFEVEQCPKLKCLPNVMTTSHRRLKRLELAFCDSLSCLPEGVGGLESLEDLDIRGLPSPFHLSIGCFDNLKTLTIGGFSSSSVVDCNGQHAVGSLTSLHLKGGDGKFATLPEELQYLSALRFLTISGYGALETLPDWISKLHSLQILKLEFCWKLVSLPPAEKMQQLKNLDELDICYCPLLEARCTKGSRPELYKISHIPTIMINSEEMKRALNKNKNKTTAQAQRNKERETEKSKNGKRNEGEVEQQGRSAASSSLQPDQVINTNV